MRSSLLFLLLLYPCAGQNTQIAGKTNSTVQLATGKEPCAGEGPFIDPKACNDYQLFFLTVVYGMVLYQASNFIADGSELLLFVPSVAGLVGSIVLPVLGAVPDGMIVLFSGLGERKQAQEQVSVGMGAQAGSTVMLLTIPWFIAVWSGKVALNADGEAQYGKSDAGDGDAAKGEGVTYENTIGKNAWIMLGTTLLFMLIQIPASLWESWVKTSDEQAFGESHYALFGLISCFVGFCGYLYYCYMDAQSDEKNMKRLDNLIEGVKNHQVSLGAALKFLTDDLKKREEELHGSPQSGEETLLGPRRQTELANTASLKKVLRPFFANCDYDRDGFLRKHEVKPLLSQLNIEPNDENIESFFGKADVSKDNRLSFEEFIGVMYGQYMRDEKKIADLHFHVNPKYIPAYDDEEEAEEIPDELIDEDPERQKKKIIGKSLQMMGFGTFLILLFSDPMVEVLGAIGDRTGISKFYISFVIAPFCSNASELIAAQSYGAKKTKQGITIGLSTLVGAACMNNTFCLGIFMALVYFQQLAWQFTAETICCVLVQWIIGAFALKSTTMTTGTAWFILFCYPVCLFGVWFLENVLGMD